MHTHIDIYIHTHTCTCTCTCVCVLSCFRSVLHYVTLFTARQAPLSMGFSRQEHWSGFPRPPQPRDWTPISCISCWQVGSSPQVPPERHIYVYKFIDQPLNIYTIILSKLGLCWLGFIFFNLIIYYIYMYIYTHTHIYLYKHIYVCTKDFVVVCVTGETISCSLSFKYFFS